MKMLISLAVLALAAPSAFARHWDGNIDLQQSVLNDHASAYVGTSFSPGEVERGSGETYGWIVLDVQAGEQHTPHQAGDGYGHGPEKGVGDGYGSVLNDLRR